MRPIAAACLVCLVVLSGCGSVAETEPTDATTVQPREYPPGVDATGVTNASALVEAHRESLAADGEYFVEVRGPAGQTDAVVELESPTHRFEHARRTGSVAAPATAEGVGAVGAYETERGRIAPYSSRGPTSDGRPGVDVVAPAMPPIGDVPPAFEGTSLAAASVAGVAALLHSDAVLAPERVQQVLAVTAVDVGPAGYDFATGYGLVAPLRAAGEVGVVTAPTATPRS